ncbi:MAG: serine/threonine protein kinase [Polyangiaceae bacterium]|nr:serine/threonine protein kinase [Polyangiaceae bacterium]
MGGSEIKEPHSGHVIAGRYELGAIIGRGGHGLVWKARDRESGRLVAVKMLTDVAAKDPHQVERLRREQIALVKLAGTSAVELIDLCRSSSGKLCLVMELLEGVDLEAHLEGLEQRGQRISVASLLAVLSPVVTTLERAHEQGIIHRDLKPANVFMLAEKAGGGVRVLDFGLARLRAQMPLTAAGTIVGSPSYIAPEAWKGKSEALDQRVDVYSFGVLVFRALAGQFPFAGNSLQEKFKAATSAARPALSPLRPDVPKEVDEWVSQVLAIDPDLRFRTLRGAWNGLLAALGNPELASALVTAEDVASAADAASPLAAPAAPPAPAPRIHTPVMPASAPPTARSEASASIELPMSGALPALKAVFKRAATAVARVAEVVTGSERLRTPIPAADAGPPPSDAPPPSRSVAVSPVMAIGTRVREGKSMVREWLAGSDFEPAGNTQREPSDVVAWLGGEAMSNRREQTLPMAVRAPVAEAAPPSLEPATEPEPEPATVPAQIRKPRVRRSAKKPDAERPAAKKKVAKKKVAKKKVAKKRATKKRAQKPRA